MGDLKEPVLPEEWPLAPGWHMQKRSDGSKVLSSNQTLRDATLLQCRQKFQSLVKFYNYTATRSNEGEDYSE